MEACSANEPNFNVPDFLEKNGIILFLGNASNEFGKGALINRLLGHTFSWTEVNKVTTRQVSSDRGWKQRRHRVRHTKVKKR